MKPVEVKDNTYIDSKKLMITILNLKLVIMLEYHDAKTFLVKDILEIDLNKILWLKKLKILFHGYMLLMISMVKKVSEHFIKKNYKKQIKNDLG